MSSEEGASPLQVLLASTRQNNLDLLTSCLASSNAPDINASDSLGTTALHNASRYCSLECLDYLLDRDGIDLDVRNRMDGDTPLHLAVRAAKDEPAVALEIVEFLIDAGADTQVKNKMGDIPLDLVSPSNQALRDALQKADLADMMTGDVVSLDDLDEDVASGGESD